MNTIIHKVLVTVAPSEDFQKQLKKLTRSTHELEVLAIAAIGFIAITEMERRNLEEQVYQLTVRVKKLERSEGE